MRELDYPFDSKYLIKKKKSLKRELLNSGANFVDKKIAVLGGSTTHDIVLMLELFLLNQGIRCEFYECEYAQYYEDVMFDNPELKAFKPDVIYFHTTNRNIRNFPEITDTKENVNKLIEAEFLKFKQLWDKAISTYNCPIIQNNFEAPYYRLLGNKDATDIHGRVRFINELNMKFADYAEEHKDFYIEDINYLSSCYGLDAWSDPLFWHMYKYALCMDAIPTLAYNVSCIIKSIFGKNKKSLVLDLDNTLWGGIVGDDGVNGIEIGQETPVSQVYSEFQSYIKAHKDLGVILNVCSKNEYDNAIAGLNHPEGILKPDDFICIKANWDPKSINLVNTAKELNLLPESFVFVDDNPAEREIIKSQVPNVAVPEIGSVEDYVRVIDHAGYFEVTNLSLDDSKRNQMYKENAMRAEFEASFTDYGEYLDSLLMTAEIKDFEPVYMERIAQLSNKSNQFNLTTRRYTRAEIEEIASSDEYIGIYGKLSDKFGDNGVVSVVIGHINGDVLDMDLWIMSCRVLKRDMEFAMMDELVKKANEKGLTSIIGHYYPTAKNSMVKEFYGTMGFEKINEDSEGNAEWTFDLKNEYNNKNSHIKVN